MISQPEQGTKQATTLEERRLFMSLPLEERRRRFALQADQFIEHYERQSAQSERIEWQAGDIVEY